MKNPRTFKETLAIVSTNALVEEVTLDTRDQKKDKELGHLEQPNTSKSHDKKRKADRSLANVERPRRNKEYRPRPGEFEGFLDRIYILTPRESTRLRTTTDSKISQMRSSRQPQRPIKRRSPKTQRMTSPLLTRRSTISTVVLTPMSQGGSRNSPPEWSWWSHLSPSST
jgi:hypothetical protein